MSTNSSKLDMILGPMFSGKTTKLLEIMDAFDKQGIKYIAVKPNIDNRYNDSDKNNFIVSHNFEKKECKVTSDLKDVFFEIKNKINNSESSDSVQYVLIDEAQFFKNLYKFCIACLEHLNINVVVTGLDGDFMRKPMGDILELLPIANTITKLSSKCNHTNCTNPGIFSHRIVADQSQVLIGGSDKYVPLCRNHYIESNKPLELNELFEGSF